MSKAQSILTDAPSALFITPLSLAALDVDDRTCPICLETYIEPIRHAGFTPDTEKEWPVTVDMVAEQFGQKRCCGHVVGRKCLEKHLRGPWAWRNSCPLCRDIWFGSLCSNSTPRESVSQNGVTDQSTEACILPRRSLRIASRVTTPATQATRMSNNHGVHKRSRSVLQPTNHSQSFVQSLLGALGVKSGTSRVNGTLDDVERVVKKLYASQ